MKFFFTSAKEKLNIGNCVLCSVADPRITFMRNRKKNFSIADPDQIFHFTARPDPAPLQSNADLRPLV
jgi:hypothetical protein